MSPCAKQENKGSLILENVTSKQWLICRDVGDNKAAWIGNAAVIAEEAERPSVEIESEQRAIAVTIGSGRAVW
jgi:hypothetical protein